MMYTIEVGRYQEKETKTYSLANTPLNAAQAPLATAKNIQCCLHEDEGEEEEELSSASILSPLLLLFLDDEADAGRVDFLLVAEEER